MAASRDPWVREYNEVVKLSDDITNMISESSSLRTTGPETQRHSSTIRRKITILSTRLDGLESLLPQLPAKQHLTSNAEQDEDLEKLEETVISTKHIALTINEELDLHKKLIDNLDELVDVTNSQLARVQRKLAFLNKRMKGGCSCLSLLLSVVGIVIVVIVLYMLIKHL